MAPLVSANQLIELERRYLAPYAQDPQTARGRRHPEPPHPYRTPFGRDRDRIIHSVAFRRLEAKTQVFLKAPNQGPPPWPPLPAGGTYRTRLTHTLEVAQIARSVARMLRLNEDLTEAIALAHDLGHPPFGHAGERALNSLLAHNGGFNHNWQSLRVVDLLERRYVRFPGLNLTWEVREGLAKHGSPGGCPPEFAGLPQPSLEAQVVDVADEIAYNNHDVDDGLASGLISLDDLAQVGPWRQAWERVSAQHADAPIALKISATVRSIIDAQVTDLVRSTSSRLAKLGLGSADEARALPTPVVGFGQGMQKANAELKAFLMQRLYRHPTVAAAVDDAAAKLADLFHAICSGRLQMPNPAPDAECDAQRAAADYLASMTDAQAMWLWNSLREGQ